MAETAADETHGQERRSFLARISSWVMFSGLVSGYGMLAALAGRFLYPNREDQKSWQFVAELAEFAAGKSLSWTSPAGAKVVVSRLGEAGSEQDFIALSSVCPHLGCSVHWEAAGERFFCPCHNGAFDAQGNPQSGPVKDANQSLARYRLKVENGLLFIHVATGSLVQPGSVS